MAFTPRQGSATITMGVDGADASRRQIDTVADALRRMNDASVQRIGGQIASLEGRFSSLQTTVGDVAQYTIAGLSLAGMITKVKDAIDVMGELDDMAQKTGSSVESLSRLQKVANAFGVDLGTVDGALTKLAKGMAGADEKGTKTGKALAALGVSTRDADGKLRSSADVMVDVARALQKYEDGAAKTALMNDLLGRSGADLLPFMNDLSENIDKFSGISAESAKRAAALQDQFGFLRVRTDELYASVAEAALPALTDLAGALTDVANEHDGMVAGKGAEWADDLAVGLARVVDVAILLPRLFSAIAGSFEVVGSDLAVLWDATPVNMARKLALGRNPVDELKQTLAERNAALEDANKKWDIAWNKPANIVEQAVLKRIAGRGQSTLAAAAGINSISSPTGPKTTLNYSGGNGDDDAAKAAANAARKDAALMADLSGVTADYMEKLEQLQRLRTAGNVSEERYVELVTELISKQPGAKAWMDEQAKAIDESNKRAAEGARGWEAIMKAHQATTARTIEDATNEALKNEELARTFGLTKSAVEQLELSRLEEQLAQRSANALTLDEIETLEKLIAAKKRNVGALAGIESAESAKKAADELTAFLDPARAQDFGDALSEAFGNAGDSLGKLTGSLDNFGRRQAEIEKQRANAQKARGTKGFDEIAYLNAVSELSEREIKNRLDGYGDMASAAKGFFDEGSKGYMLLEGAEQAFRAMELASQMESLYTHLFVTTTKATATTAGQAVETTAVAAGEAARNSAKVPGVFMSFMSALGPWGMAAAGVAIAAVLGGAFSGGGSSVSLSESRQKTQGTGTVLGSDAKSESISKSLDLIEDASFQGLSISNDMLSALRSIDSNLTGFSSLVVRTTGIRGTLAAGLDEGSGGFWAKLGNSIFGGKTTVEDSGFSMDRIAMEDVFKGVLSSYQYADVKKDGGWFSSDKRSTRIEGLGLDGNRQVASILTSLYDAVRSAGQTLELTGDDFTMKLNSFVVDIGKVSLKGLDGEEMEKEIQAVFSKVGDQMAAFSIEGLARYQQTGEGYLETLTRVATGYQTVTVVADSLGMAFAAVGMESIEARQRLIDLTGGLDQFKDKADQFMSDFYTDEERANALRTRITPTLNQFGIATGQEDSLEQFRNVAVGLDLTSAAGAQAFATLMEIAPAFKQIADVDAAKFEERAELQDQLDELTMTSSQLLDKQRDALDDSNRALFDQVQLAERAATVRSERAELQDQLDELTMTSSQLLAKQRDALDASNRALFDQVQLEERAAAVRSERTSLQDELDSLTMTSSQLLAKQRDALDESNRALFDQVQAAKEHKAATEQASEVIRAAQEAAAATIRSFGDAVLSSMTRATDAAKALRDFNDSLLLGNLSALDPDARYREAKRLFEAADPSDTQAAQAFLQASKDRGADSLYYQLDFAAVQAKLAQGAAELDAYATRLPDFYRGVAQMMSTPTFTQAMAPAAPVAQVQYGSMSGRSAFETNKAEILLEQVIDRLEKVVGSTEQFADQFDRVTEGGNGMVNK